MARILPFRPWRCSPATVHLDNSIFWPCNKISATLRQAFYPMSCCNRVRAILGLPEHFDAGKGESVYTRPAQDFRGWRKHGVRARKPLSTAVYPRLLSGLAIDALD